MNSLLLNSFVNSVTNVCNKTWKFELLLHTKIAKKRQEVAQSDNWLPFKYFSKVNESRGDLFIVTLYTFMKTMCQTMLS